MSDTLKILVLIGSPRNEESWSYRVAQMFEQSVRAGREAEFEYVFVEKLKLPFCDGCLKCVTVSETACPEYAIVGPVAEKMNAADGIILVSPVHTFAITGLMKNFVEYFMYKRNRPSFFGKKTLCVAVAAGGGQKNVLDVLENTSTAWGCDVVGQLGISTKQMPKPRYKALVDDAIAKLSTKFVAEIDKGEMDSPRFRHLINFRVMQIMTQAATKTVNHTYWKERGWFGREYYTDVRINPFHRVMAAYIARKIRQGIKKGNSKPIRVD